MSMRARDSGARAPTHTLTLSVCLPVYGTGQIPSNPREARE